MRRFGWVAFALVFLILAAAPAALAEKPIALLIGNEAYTTEIGRLANPHNDAAPIVYKPAPGSRDRSSC